MNRALDQIKAAEATLLLPTYERNPLLFVGGNGVYLEDEHGEKYLDLLSGIGVNALGYAHPAIERAIAEQSKKLIHISNLFYHPGQAELALRLTEMSGLDRAFFCNSGTEAWEAAMKVARAYAGLLRAEGKQIGTKFLAIENSFHGRTFGSVSTTHKAKYREPFAPTVPGVEFVRFNDIEDLRAKFSNEVCAILLEPIQGEGGIRPIVRRLLPGRARPHSLDRSFARSPTKSNPASAAPGSGLPISTTASSPTSPLSPSRSPEGFPSEPCSALKPSRKPFIPACTAQPSAEAH